MYIVDSEWGSLIMPDVLDVLFVDIPTRWRRECVAAFLLFLGEKMITTYLLSKMTTDETTVARLVADMVVMTTLFNDSLSLDRGIGQVFDKIVKYLTEQRDKDRFFRTIWTTLSTQIQYRELQVSNDDIMRIFEAFGCFVTGIAYM
jgi:predicted acetyltransferase